MIDQYDFGHIVIDGVEHTKDVIVLPERVVPEWWRKEGHSLDMDDLADVIDELPERLIIGRGAYGRMTPNEGALRDLEARGISIEVLDTGDAVTRYNELDPRQTAAALHLTC
ncbi:MAG: MTH938/NDUFAF3 family protein [Actinomycetota bacterium]